MKILCTIDGFSEEAKKALESFAEVDYFVPTQEELVEKVANYDALLVRIGLNIDEQVIEAGKKLKAIATATTGLNHIDLEYAKSKGVEVLSLKDEIEFLDTITSTAELAFGLMIDLMRFNPWAYETVKNYDLDLERFRGHSLYGKTIGIVGMGRLGKIIAHGAKGWRMNVLFCDPFVSQEKFPEFKKVALGELLAKADAVSIHVHLAKETEKMFNKDIFKQMKKSAFLINTARGELVDEEELLHALKSGEIAGYATDVLTNELELVKNFSDHPLVEYAKGSENCIIVPHTGGLTHDSRIGTDVFIAEKMKKFFK